MRSAMRACRCSVGRCVYSSVYIIRLRVIIMITIVVVVLLLFYYDDGDCNDHHWDGVADGDDEVVN